MGGETGVTTPTEDKAGLKQEIVLMRGAKCCWRTAAVRYGAHSLSAVMLPKQALLMTRDYRGVICRRQRRVEL